MVTMRFVSYRFSMLIGALKNCEIKVGIWGGLLTGVVFLKYIYYITTYLGVKAFS